VGGEGVNEQEGECDGQEHQDEDEEGVNLGQGRHGGQEKQLFCSNSKPAPAFSSAVRAPDQIPVPSLPKAATVQGADSTEWDLSKHFFGLLVF
jgi:hypothetical protein